MRRLFILYAAGALITFVVQGHVDGFTGRCDFGLIACAGRLPGYSIAALLWPAYLLFRLA